MTGQMFHLRDKGFVFFVASPYIRTWEDLEARTMKLADLPMWDATRDFLLSDMAFRYWATFPNRIFLSTH